MTTKLLCNHCHTGQLKKPEDHHPSYLVCENCNAIQLRYSPQNYQSTFHEIPYTWVKNEAGEDVIAIQIVGAFGGYGSGKSKTSLQEIVLRALENPGGTGLLTAPTLQQLKRTTIKTLLQEVLPPSLIENYNKSDGKHLAVLKAL